MTFTNYEAKEINCKIIFFGAKGAGKTENLRSIFRNTSKEVRSGFLELANKAAPTQYFDFLPLSLGHVNDYHLKMHLYSFNAQCVYDSLISVLLKGVDGYIFVADSRLEAMGDNIQSLVQARQLLLAESYDVSQLPHVVQYNKQDLPALVPIEILRQELNPEGVPEHEAIATDAAGTMETVQSMAKLILEKLATT